MSRSLYLSRRNLEDGFTLVEILIVVVIIGILALIAIPIYLNQQQAAKDGASQQSLQYLNKAALAAKQKSGKSLYAVTGRNCTACSMFGVGAGTALTSAQDPLNKPKTDVVWTTYFDTLRKISDASGMDVTNLVDGNGRPLIIDENEAEGGPTSCNKDSLGVSRDPLTGWGVLAYSRLVANTTPGCI